jgi:hypothetical protein
MNTRRATEGPAGVLVQYVEEHEEANFVCAYVD